MRQSFAGRRKNMRPDIKDGFDKAVAADAARTTAQREVQERARTERENFKADWEHTREHVIFPAFEQIRDILMPKGWTLALARTSVLRPSQSAQLSEAIIFFRFQNRNACAARWRLSPAAHTGQPCDNTMRPATSADTASV